MYKWIFAAALSAAISIGALLPASVEIDGEKVNIPHSRIAVLAKNIVGDFKGYGRCSITDLSFWWAGTDGFYYSDQGGGGMVFSKFAVDRLLLMQELEDPVKAYRIAQRALDKRQRESWEGKRHKLQYPLRSLTGGLHSTTKWRAPPPTRSHGT